MTYFGLAQNLAPCRIGQRFDSKQRCISNAALNAFDNGGRAWSRAQGIFGGCCGCLRLRACMVVVFDAALYFRVDKILESQREKNTSDKGSADIQMRTVIHA